MLSISKSGSISFSVLISCLLGIAGNSTEEKVKMADQGQSEGYLDYSRPAGSAKKGKKKRKNKKNRNNGDGLFMQGPPADEVADEESFDRKAADEQHDNDAGDAVTATRPDSINKESEIPEADRVELKESETPEAERVEELSPTESVSFEDYAEDKENADVVDNIAENIAEMENIVDDIEEIGIEATALDQDYDDDEEWMPQQKEYVQDVIDGKEKWKICTGSWVRFQRCLLLFYEIFPYGSPLVEYYSYKFLGNNISAEVVLVN